MSRLRLLLLGAALLAAGCRQKASAPKIRVGYFPNITHAQALIGMAEGRFERDCARLGFAVEPKVFNAGPSAVEALFADAIDLTYIGPGPALNAYVKSGGLFQIVSGAASGGAALIVREDAAIRSPADFAGRKLATPQLGNTQDLSARFWLKSHGLKPREKGGSVQVMPVANPDQLTLFLKKEIDAAWTVEPWASRLILEGKGRLFLSESDLWKPLTGGKYATTVILVSARFLRENPGAVRQWLQTHCEITDWIASHPEEARNVANEQIKKLTGKPLSEELLKRSFRNVEFTVDPAPLKLSLKNQADWAYEEGFLGKEKPDLSRIFNFDILAETLKQKRTGAAR